MNKQEFDRENSELITGFLNRTHFAGWKMGNINNPVYANYRNIELQVNANCNLSCSYCYYDKYKEQLYPKELNNTNQIKTNLELLLDWFISNNLLPEFDLFSGELLVQDIGIYILERLINWHVDNKYEGFIKIPTNFSWIMNDAKVQKIQELINFGKINSVFVGLSCSIDGKFADKYRPFKNGFSRTENYYQRIFEFCSKNDFGFHPMLYSEAIQDWIDNFLWFQDMFVKHNINWEKIYLLEVRNSNWTDQNNKDLYKFIRFVIKWIYGKLDSIGLSDKDKVEFIFKHRLMNLLSGLFSTNGRGIGCSVQSTVQLRLGDLSGTLCHRQSYKQLQPWKFVVENEKIVGINALNIAPYIAEQTTTHRNFPFCQSCFIKHLCIGGCPGAQYEINGDVFIPIPTVCAMEHVKVASILDAIKEVGLLSYFYHAIASEKRDTVDLYFSDFKGRM